MSDHEASPAPSLREALVALRAGHVNCGSADCCLSLERFDQILALAQPAPAVLDKRHRCESGLDCMLDDGHKGSHSNAEQVARIRAGLCPWLYVTPAATTPCTLGLDHEGEHVYSSGPTPAPALEDRLLLLKALGRGRAALCVLSGVPHVGLPDMEIDAATRWVAAPLDAEGFPILTDALRAELIEATHG